LTEIKGDIRDRAKMLEAAKGCDAFIHLACISNDPSFDLDPELGKSINFAAFSNVVDACLENGIGRLIVASSTSQYGVKPLDVEVTEECEAEPITDYARFKIECEHLLEQTGTGDLEYVFARPSTLCGYAPRLRLDLSVNILTIHALINKKILIFGGEQMRPVLNILDMVRFYDLMLTVPGEKINGQAFNLTTGNMTIRQVAELVRDVVDDPQVEFEVRPNDDRRSYHVNADKVKRELGFECRYSVEDAVRTLMDAYRKGYISDGLNNPMYYNIARMKEINLK
jgi:nucleoside-diphosphate-sugar epimerase